MKDKDAMHAAYRVADELLKDRLKEKAPEILNDLENLKAYLEQSPAYSDVDFHNKLWQLFFPEGVGVMENKHTLADKLRKSRIVTIKEPNPGPLKNPCREILIAANVLLTIPAKNTDIESLNYDDQIKEVLRIAVKEPQLYWFDHPVQIGRNPQLTGALGAAILAARDLN